MTELNCIEFLYTFCDFGEGASEQGFGIGKGSRRSIVWVFGVGAGEGLFVKSIPTIRLHHSNKSFPPPPHRSCNSKQVLTAVELELRQARADQGRPGQARADKGRPRQTRADQGRSRQTTARADQGRTQQTKTDQAKPGQTMAGQGRPRQTRGDRPRLLKRLARPFSVHVIGDVSPSVL